MVLDKLNPIFFSWLMLTNLGSFGAIAQTSDISVVSSVQISIDEPSVRHVESCLAINPRNPRNLVAASIVLGERTGVAVYSSHDAGMSWLRATHGVSKGLVFEGLDPALAFDIEGNVYLVTGKVAVWRSADGGKIWGDPVGVPGSGYDRPFISCDVSGREGYGGLVYMSGKLPITVFGHPGMDAIALSASRDRGASFSFPRLVLPAPEKEQLNLVSDLLVLADGKVILVLQTFPPQDLTTPLVTGAYSIIVSEDGGRSFSEPRRVANFRTYGHAAEGKSLLGIGGGRLAVDSSGGSRQGRLYLTWLDVVDGYHQVMAAASANVGRTWSRPVQVTDSKIKSDQSNPAIAVNNEGVVGISWNDRRGDRTDRCYQLFFAASTDGGATFSANRKLNEQFTCPIGRPSIGSKAIATPDPSVEAIRSEYRFKNGGDTQGIVGMANGAFHLAWINGESGELQLWSTVIVVSPH